MVLSKERKGQLAEHLRGTSVAKENITPECRKNLELADKETMVIPVGENDEVTCYISTAKNRTANCPVHINIHDGGFIRPHVEHDEIYPAKVADAIQGIVVDADYKLVPEYPFPTASDETYEVCRWTFSKLDERDTDEKRVSMGGHSAGANLTVATALKAKQTGDFALYPQVLDYGAFDMATDPADKKETKTNMIPVKRGRMLTEAYTDGELEKVKNLYCSPLLADDEMLKGLPETLVVAMGYDNFRFEDFDYAVRVAVMGNRVTLRCFTQSNHGFIIHYTEEWEVGQELVISMIQQARLN